MTASFEYPNISKPFLLFPLANAGFGVAAARQVDGNADVRAANTTAIIEFDRGAASMRWQNRFIMASY